MTTTPAPPRPSSPRRDRYRFAAWAVGLFAGGWFVSRLLIEPALLHYARPEPFLWDARFLAFEARFIGGPAGLAAAGLHYALQVPWLGAAVMAGLATAAAALLRLALGRAGARGPAVDAASIAVGVLMLARHAAYIPALGADVAVASGLALAWAWLALGERHVALRLAVFAALMAAGVYAAGGGALAGAAVCILAEALLRRRWPSALALAAIAAAMPWGLSRWLYEPDLALLALRHLPVASRAGRTVLGYSLTAAAPAATVVAAMAAWRRPAEGAARPSRRREAVLAAGAALVAAAVVAAAYDGNAKAAHRFTRDVVRGWWDRAYTDLWRLRGHSPLLRGRINLTLAHVGRLGDEMFTCPQQYGPYADLLLSDPALREFPHVFTDRAALMLELGHVNRAAHQAANALELSGPSPEALRTLAMAHVAQGRPDAARVSLRVLARVPWQEAAAREMLTRLEGDPTLRGTRGMAMVRQRRPREDAVGPLPDDAMLEMLLAADARNELAYRLLIAHHMLMGDLAALKADLDRWHFFGKSELPRHWEEALFQWAFEARETRLAVTGVRLRRETAMRHKAFLERYASVRGDTARAWEALAGDFGDTYWFYKRFGRSAAAGPPDAGVRGGSP